MSLQHYFDIRLLALLVGLLILLTIMISYRKGRESKKGFHPGEQQPYIREENLPPISPDNEPKATAPLQTNQPATQQEEDNSGILVVYLRSSPRRPYVGYELLQALLSAELRFGSMNIFHRYADLNRKETVLFSLASAQKPGTFDIHHMGAVSTQALSLFLKQTGNPEHDIRALDLMLETANQLIEDLGGELLDKRKQHFTPNTYKAYCERIHAMVTA